MTAVMEDEVIADLADQGEESSSSLIAGCRNLLRAVTKVGSGTVGISLSRIDINTILLVGSIICIIWILDYSLT